MNTIIWVAQALLALALFVTIERFGPHSLWAMGVPCNRFVR
jgi:hypothetical protein